jgi:bacillolysin
MWQKQLKPHAHHKIKNMKFSANSTTALFISYMLSKSVLAQHTTKGLVLVKGGFFSGKIDVSSFASAQAAGIAILQALPEYSGDETFVPQNSDSNHMRYGQQIHGMDVEGASLYVHVDKLGMIVGVNGEIVDGTSVPSEPTIDASTAIDAALKESRVPTEVHGNCSPPTLTVVRGLKDGEAHLAWTCTIRYDIVGEDGYLEPFNDQIFARATGDIPGLIQIHPKIYGARSLETRNCMQAEDKDNCTIVSTSSDKIVQPSDLPVEAAHNFAIDTYNYYMQKHGRDSIDNRGMTITSLVHYGEKIMIASWDGSRMLYGDGDGVGAGPSSLALDIVAHELTHGVTDWTSNLNYRDESGKFKKILIKLL